MFKRLMNAIGTALNIIHRATPAPQAMDSQTGGSNSTAQATPAAVQAPQRKRKPSVALSIKREPLHKPVRKTAKATTQPGKQQATPASTAVKRKAKPKS